MINTLTALYRDTRTAHKTCTWTAKSSPYPPCTVTAYWLKYLDSARLLRRVTQPPFIAVPLGFIAFKKTRQPSLDNIS